MSKDELSNFVNILNNYDKVEYLYSTILCSAAPTLAREKVSSLITFSNNNRNLHNTWEEFKSEIISKIDVKFFELKKNENNTTVLFYHEEELRKILSQEKNMEFLKRFGYNNKMNLEDCLLFLSQRFQHVCPHEIGIFLGYPVDDVTMFIDCPNKKCKIIGYWKVYHDTEVAKKIFIKYDEIRANVINLLITGSKPIDILTKKLAYKHS